jgi:hypothetical protein
VVQILLGCSCLCKNSASQLAFKTSKRALDRSSLRFCFEIATDSEVGRKSGSTTFTERRNSERDSAHFNERPRVRRSFFYSRIGRKCSPPSEREGLDSVPSYIGVKHAQDISQRRAPSLNLRSQDMRHFAVTFLVALANLSEVWGAATPRLTERQGSGRTTPLLTGRRRISFLAIPPKSFTHYPRFSGAGISSFSR